MCLKSRTLNLQPDIGKPSRPSEAKPVAWEVLRSVPGHVTRREYGTIYFWMEARIDPFPAVPTTTLLLKYILHMSKSANTVLTNKRIT
jgi:hypothetical protein